ncbi:hypothetical protein TFKS16_0561 [Tannerella forsythia KS16]|nr:hypothetical protein TF3313_0306 [Tannerella forsythia 3313]BAR50869.1 hypothetical protein TFKS16_0561 [Tannerella forsythia KS16]
MCAEVIYKSYLSELFFLNLKILCFCFYMIGVLMRASNFNLKNYFYDF